MVLLLFLVIQALPEGSACLIGAPFGVCYTIFAAKKTRQAALPWVHQDQLGSSLA